MFVCHIVFNIPDIFKDCLLLSSYVIQRLLFKTSVFSACDVELLWRSLLCWWEKKFRRAAWWIHDLARRQFTLSVDASSPRLASVYYFWVRSLQPGCKTLLGMGELIMLAMNCPRVAVHCGCCYVLRSSISSWGLGCVLVEEVSVVAGTTSRYLRG